MNAQAQVIESDSECLARAARIIERKWQKQKITVGEGKCSSFAEKGLL